MRSARVSLKLVFTIGAVLAGLTASSAAAALSDLHTVADVVLGQPNFNTSGGRALAGVTSIAADESSGRIYAGLPGQIVSWSNDRLISTNQPPDLSFPFPKNGSQSPRPLDAAAIATDPDGRVYASDVAEGRVLRYSPPFQSGPDLVLGQPDLASTECNTGGLSARSLCQPFGLAFDAGGRLYIADSANNRVLRFSPPFITGQAADLVLGEPDFITTSADCGHVDFLPSAASMCQPRAVAVDQTGGVFVGDSANSRILRFTSPSTDDELADLVLGQPDFVMRSSACQNNTNAARLCNIGGITLDSSDNLFVTDGNSRILGFPKPFTNGEPAGLVIGQPSFTSFGCNTGGISASSVCFPVGLAVDFRDSLFAADSSNSRVLRYDHPSGGTAPQTGAVRMPPSM